MTINDKIKQILIDKNLTPSYFADEIGVQRSSISHILSGRNRPSFDIIQKIIRRFPELGYEWIMEEESASVNRSATNGGYGNRNQVVYASERSERFTPPQPVPTYPTAQSGGIRTQRHEIPPVAITAPPINEQATTTELEPPVTIDKKVERILIFYTDGSFREYTPAQAQSTS